MNRRKIINASNRSTSPRKTFSVVNLLFIASHKMHLINIYHCFAVKCIMSNVMFICAITETVK